MIEVWFDDEYKEFFETREPVAKFIDPGDITDQLQIKRDMKCRGL